ncbi:MAG: Dyp-type peroxidase, partial [Burkholderiales bacterium]|nr:Dyp-type peroxidase [Burkholderiales bacterium]
MRRELITKSRSLVGTSDLTLLAPITTGLVPALESISHKSRIKTLLQALNTGRSTAHEYALLRPFSDAVERVGKIHSVRVAVLEPANQVLLAVTFDGSWESYLRVLWQKVGTLLDIIFYDTEGYVCAYDRGYDEWAAWVRRVQVETHFFYGTPALTVGDVPLLQAEERQRRSCPYRPGNEVAAARRHQASAETLAWQQVTASPATGTETFKQGLEAMAALYRLTALYQPGTDDGQVLLRAVRDLLLEFVLLLESGAVPPAALDEAHQRFDKQLVWLQQRPTAPRERQRVAPPLPPGPPAFDAADVQAGILSAHDGVTDGALLLLAIEDRVRAQPFLHRMVDAVRKHSDPPATADDTLVNVGFSYEGLRAAGLTEDELALFPQEFREGMAARASLLGDHRLNHPRRWRLPPRRGAHAGADGQVPAVEWSAVHLVLQLRWVAPPSDDWCEIEDPRHPLHGRYKVWADAAEGHGVAVLAVQTLHRYHRAAPTDPAPGPAPALQVEEHFGFADGNSDPVLDPAEAGRVYPNRIQLGELLVGAANEADWPLDPERRPDPALERQRLAWLGNGSFLVLRKLVQNRARLDQLVADAAAATGLAPALVRAKLMGRWDDGTPLVGSGGPGAAHNDFDYRDDPDGARCPFHAHIRRVNPRPPPGLHEPAGRRTPRIARRGMSYGPRYGAGRADAQAERGLVFMAYNASLAEQFEVLQGWLTGGNSSGAGSDPSDPFLGVPVNGRRREYRFEVPGSDGQPRVVSLALDGSDAWLGDPDPIVRLAWGGYLFAPSMSALRRLCDRA